MDARSLREKQAPLKASYKEDAASARRTLFARGRVAQGGVTFALETGRPELTERYCVVLQTLAKPPSIEARAAAPGG